MAKIVADFRRKTAKALSVLQNEIGRRERELQVLTTEAARWQQVMGAPLPKKEVAERRPRAGRRARVDWSAVLSALPSAFTAHDAAETSGKPIVQARSQLSRWLKAKKVRRTKSGYQKT